MNPYLRSVSLGLFYTSELIPSGFFYFFLFNTSQEIGWEEHLQNDLFGGYSIIGSGSGFTMNLGSDSLGKSNDLSVSNVSWIHFGFGFIVKPDLIIE